MASVKKFDESAVVNQLRHIERTIQNPENKDICKERTVENYSLAPQRGISSYDYYVERKKELYCYNRKDVKVMAGWIVTVPKNLKESDRERFFQVTYEFLIERYGERNCIQAIVHNDEGGQPHMHFLFIPATSDQKHGGEKICANDVLNKTELRNFHPALQKWLIDHDVQANILTPSNPAQKPSYDAIESFADDHADEFTLEHENIVGDELKAKIKTDIAGDTVPDIFIYWGSGGNSTMLLDADVIIPFDEYLDASELVSRDLFPEESFSRTSSKGTLTTITTSLQYGVWLCNKALFEEYGLEYPKTLDDMIEVGKVFNENGITPFAMGSKGGNPAHEFVAEILGQMPDCEKDFENLTQNYTIDTPNIHNTLEIVDTMRENNLFPADTISIGDWNQQFALYNEGKAAMIYAWTWQIPNITEETAENSVIIDAPVMPGGTRDTSNFTRAGGDMGYMISKKAWEDDTKKQAIIDIVDYLYSTEMQEIGLYNAGDIPARNDVEIDDAKVTVPLLADIIAYGKGKESCPNFPQTCPKTECWTDFADGFDELFAGISTPDEVIEHIDESLESAKN